MKEVSGRGGRTVLFVSHNMTAVQNLCDRCLWLDRGNLARDGSAISTIKKYLENNKLTTGRKGQVHVETSSFSVKKCKVNESEEPTVLAGQPCCFQIDYECPQPELFSKGIRVSLSLCLKDEKIANLWTACYPDIVIRPKKTGRIECKIESWPFREGEYSLDVYVDEVTGSTLQYVRGIVVIDSRNGDFFSGGRDLPPGEGIMYLHQKWSHS